MKPSLSERPGRAGPMHENAGGIGVYRVVVHLPAVYSYVIMLIIPECYQCYL
jgi:hypothetical protein